MVPWEPLGMSPVTTRGNSKIKMGDTIITKVASQGKRCPLPFGYTYSTSPKCGECHHLIYGKEVSFVFFPVGCRVRECHHPLGFWAPYSIHQRPPSSYTEMLSGRKDWWSVLVTSLGYLAWEAQLFCMCYWDVQPVWPLDPPAGTWDCGCLGWPCLLWLYSSLLRPLWFCLLYRSRFVSSVVLRSMWCPTWHTSHRAGTEFWGRHLARNTVRGELKSYLTGFKLWLSLFPTYYFGLVSLWSLKKMIS